MNWFSSTSREILRWYLRKFPLRDGKTFFYQRFSPRLTPPELLLPRPWRPVSA